MIKGLVGFPITPADEQGRVDAEGYTALVRRVVDGGADLVCALGSTGTYAYLDRDQRRRAVEQAAAAIDGRVPLMAGIGALRTDDAIVYARDAAMAGAAYALLAPMSYTPLTRDEVVTHFAAVAEASPIPVCLYDNPAATHCPIDDELLQRLARLRNVVACKGPAPEGGAVRVRVERLRSLTPPGFSVGFSHDAHAAEMLIAGADAWYSVLGGLFPAPVVAIRRAVAAGDAAEARRINERLEPVWRLMRRHGGVRLMFAAARVFGLTTASPPRPILPLSAADTAEVAGVIEALAPILEPMPTGLRPVLAVSNP